MQPTEIYKLVITVINISILLSLPGWVIWHFKKLRYFEWLEFDWWIQVICVLAYASAVNREIPALWSRWLSYFHFKITTPEILYVLTTWDRGGAVFQYCILMILTWSITQKRVPKAFKDAITN